MSTERDFKLNLIIVQRIQMLQNCISNNRREILEGLITKVKRYYKSREITNLYKHLHLTNILNIHHSSNIKIRIIEIIHLRSQASYNSPIIMALCERVDYRIFLILVDILIMQKAEINKFLKQQFYLYVNLFIKILKKLR